LNIEMDHEGLGGGECLFCQMGVPLESSTGMMLCDLQI